MTSNVSNLKYKRLEDVAKSLIDLDNPRRCHHSSFILYKNRIVAIGANLPKTHPTNLKNRKVSKVTGEDYSTQKHICSEFNAIQKLRKLTNIDTKKCSIINIRYDRNKKLALAKPCMSCENLLRYFEFKKVVWTTDQGTYQES
jgi:deoxycytidylate deaminase